MSEQTTSAQTTSIKRPGGVKVSGKDSQLKLPANRNIKSVFEPASKIAVLGYN
jgi:hypothetical protein